MHRFFLPPEFWTRATLGPDESRHCVNVLRHTPGDLVSVFDGAGRQALAEIVSASPRAVTLSISTENLQTPPPCRITLAQAIPKGKNMDLVVQKAVELGAARIVPLLTERTIVRLAPGELEKKREKWHEIAIEACKQCGQNFLPSVELPHALGDFLSGPFLPDFLLLASLQPDARPLKSLLAAFESAHGSLPRNVGVLIGPEGDFSPAECELARESGAEPMTLGPIVLRTETAAIYCLSVLAHELFPPEPWMPANLPPPCQP